MDFLKTTRPPAVPWFENSVRTENSKQLEVRSWWKIFCWNGTLPETKMSPKVVGKMSFLFHRWDMGVSKNRGTPKSSISIGFSIINHPFWGTPIFGNTHMFVDFFFGVLKVGKNKLFYPPTFRLMWGMPPSEVFGELMWAFHAVRHFRMRWCSCSS